jgi:hypothetical protein
MMDAPLRCLRSIIIRDQAEIAGMEISTVVEAGLESGLLRTRVVRV